MKKRLNEEVLKPGDIALTTSDALISKAIRTVTLSKVSHAMLYVTHSSIIHAVGDGVRAENTQRIVFDEDAAVYVMRLKGGLLPSDAQSISDHARTIVGTQYSRFEAGRSIFGGASFSAKQFCSRLVGQVYDRCGLKLVPDPNYCTPESLLNSSALEHVADATRLVSDEEAEYFSNSGNWLDEETQALNLVLSGVRAYDKSIQNISDIGRFVIHSPIYDQMTMQLLVTSGYLDFWKKHVEEGPWRFDIGLMNKNEDRRSVRKYCEATLKSEPRDDNRFAKTLCGLEADNTRYPRQTFKVLIELYKKLTDLHACRVDTAAKWLETQTGVYP